MSDVPPARYTGDFIAWPGGAMLIGQGSGPIAPHAHYAIQLAIAEPAGSLKVMSGRNGAWQPCLAALVPSNVVHSIDVTDCDWSAVVFMEPETPAGRAVSLRLRGEVASLDGDALVQGVRDLGQAWQETRTTEAVLDAAQALVCALSGTLPHVPSDPRVLQAIEHLRSRATDAPSLEELAALVHLSPSRFRHLFVEETGMALRTYQLWRRLLRVWEFLMQGESLAGAAHAAGFADSAHLSRTSKSMFGLPPSGMQMSGPLSERLQGQPRHQS